MYLYSLTVSTNNVSILITYYYLHLARYNTYYKYVDFSKFHVIQMFMSADIFLPLNCSVNCQVHCAVTHTTNCQLSGTSVGSRVVKNRAHSVPSPNVIKGTPNQGADCSVS